MPKQNHRKVYLFAVVVILVIAVALPAMRSSRDARFNLIDGKPAIVWLSQMDGGVNPDVVLTFARSQEVGIPALLDLIQMRDHFGTRFYNLVWPRLPARVQSKVPPPRPAAVEFRAAAARVFFHFGNPHGLIGDNRISIDEKYADQVVRALRAALGDKNQNVRMNAASALGYQNSRAAEAIDACVEALEDLHWAVRFNALLSLGHLARADDSAIPILRGALSDRHPNVAKQAAEELAKLGVSSRRQLMEK